MFGTLWFRKYWTEKRGMGLLFLSDLRIADPRERRNENIEGLTLHLSCRRARYALPVVTHGIHNRTKS